MSMKPNTIYTLTTHPARSINRAPPQINMHKDRDDIPEFEFQENEYIEMDLRLRGDFEPEPIIDEQILNVYQLKTAM